MKLFPPPLLLLKLVPPPANQPCKGSSVSATLNRSSPKGSPQIFVKMGFSLVPLVIMWQLLLVGIIAYDVHATDICLQCCFSS